MYHRTNTNILNWDGGDTMALETRIILSLLAKVISNAETVEEAYNAVVDTANNVEGMSLPSYDEVMTQKKEIRNK